MAEFDSVAQLLFSRQISDGQKVVVEFLNYERLALVLGRTQPAIDNPGAFTSNCVQTRDTNLAV